MRKQFTFVENERTSGVVQQLKQLAKEDQRSFNNYIGIILKKYINERQPKKDN